MQSQPASLSVSRPTRQSANHPSNQPVVRPLTSHSANGSVSHFLRRSVSYDSNTARFAGLPILPDQPNQTTYTTIHISVHAVNLLPIQSPTIKPSRHEAASQKKQPDSQSTKPTQLPPFPPPPLSPSTVTSIISPYHYYQESNKPRKDDNVGPSLLILVYIITISSSPSS